MRQRSPKRRNPEPRARRKDNNDADRIVFVSKELV